MINLKEKLSVDISKIDKTKFYIQEEKGFFFIHSRKNVWDWTEDERKIRSIIVDANGFIMSSGWPKFGNLNESGFEKDSEILTKALETNQVVRFTHKEDGSLCIRSVIDGEVVLRTRGTMWGGTGTEEEDSFGDRFKDVAKKYPSILDPSWMTDRSLLFEFVSPNNTIVLKYKEEDLVFIGYICHKDLSIGKWEDVEKVSKEGNLNLVRKYNLSRDINSLIDDVKTWKEEGVVVRCNDDQTFLKIKSAYYLANHRMKYFMTYKNILEFLLHLNILAPGNEDKLEQALKDCEYDWEIIVCAKDFYNRFVAAYYYAHRKVNQAEVLLEEWIDKNKNIFWDSESSKRKEFAKFACAQNGLATFMFNLYDIKFFGKNKTGLTKQINKIIVGEENLTRSKKNA